MGGLWWSVTLLGRQSLQGFLTSGTLGSSGILYEGCHMDSTTSEIMAMIWALHYILQERRYHDIRWTVTTDSKITLGIIHNRHGYTPNADLGAYLTVIVREVRHFCSITFVYTKSHDADPWNHLADTIARSNLVIQHGCPHADLAD
eukprot:877318-Pyramimonas_sp.AAC.1